MASVEGIYNFLPLTERIGTAGQPTAEEFVAVKAAGYDVVINLLPVTSPDALPDEDRLVSGLGLEYVHIPVDWQNPTAAEVERFFDTLDAHQDHRVFVHCAANMRVSAFTYLYRILRQNMDRAEAAADLYRIWTPNETWQDFMDSFHLREDRPTDMTFSEPLLGEAVETPVTALLKPLLGAHMPTAGGHHFALSGGKDIGCRAVQIFTSSPRQWRAPEIKDETVEVWRAALADSGIVKTVAHDSYLINLAAPPGSEVLEKSRAAFRGEIERAEALGIGFLVSHPGAHGGDGEAVGIARLIESFDVIHAETAGAKVRTAIETTAGQGTYLGGKFEQIAQIIQGVKNPERLAVCLDTCHVFAAGYDIRTPEGYDETMRLFDEIIGLEWLQVIHANDSAKAFGSHADRHAHIGEGEIGLEAFRLLVNDPRLAGLPIIVETPDSETMHEVNLRRLRELMVV